MCHQLGYPHVVQNLFLSFFLLLNMKIMKSVGVNCLITFFNIFFFCVCVCVFNRRKENITDLEQLKGE